VGSETGQATSEWVALALVVVLGLSALSAIRGPLGDRRLGEVVAERVGCAAGGACARGPRRVGVPAGSEAALRGPPAPVAPPRAVPPRAAPPRAAPPPASRAKLIDAFRRLRSVGSALARRAWIVCLGYRRFRYELEHPRAPTEPMPLDEALDIANGCLNPFGFLAGPR
jgi:hypothetical protein